MTQTAISQNKKDQLKARMAELDIKESDLTEKFITGGGSGGQKINKTASCVYLKHAPSGIEIKCQKTRSQSQNRFWARRELCEKIAEMKSGEKSKKRQAAEKIRRQKRKRSKRAKEKMLDAKNKRSKTKALRKKPKGSGYV